MTAEITAMRPLIDEARHHEIMKPVGEEAWHELLDQFCLDAAWIVEGMSVAAGEEACVAAAMR